jgi:hypothetical protein
MATSIKRRADGQDLLTLDMWNCQPTRSPYFVRELMTSWCMPSKIRSTVELRAERIQSSAVSNFNYAYGIGLRMDCPASISRDLCSIRELCNRWALITFKRYNTTLGQTSGGSSKQKDGDKYADL